MPDSTPARDSDPGPGPGPVDESDVDRVADTDRDRVRVTVRHDGGETVLRVEPGTNLRRLLLAAGLSPYTRVTSRVNCGGRGLCATCGVRIRTSDSPAPTHWHDRLAARFGYPRLSCQVTVDRDLTVSLVDKLVWGGRE